MNEPVGFGVIGANSYVANAAVLPAIDAAVNARLVATASRSGAVAPRWAATEVADYNAVLDHPGVEAVYIPLPNGMHREWTERAAAAGKHVLCEKPLAADAPTAQAMADACHAADVMLAEAWMTPFGSRWATTMGLVRDGTIGEVDHQRHAFTFTIGPDAADNYRWDPSQGGGALLDVGIYTVGTAVELWGTDCDIADVTRTRASTGVDSATSVTLTWAGNRRAEIECSFVDAERQLASFHGDGGVLALEHAAFTSGHDLDHVVARHVGGEVEELTVATNDAYHAMIEAFASAVRGDAQWPRPVERSIELLRLLDRIRDTNHD